MQAVLLITRDCNFRCDYCYAGEKRAWAMPPAVLEAAAHWLLGLGQGPLGVGFCGGEPLTAFDLLKTAVRLLEEGRGKDRTLHFSISTNGSLLDDDAARFLEDHGFLVQYSMDGSRAMHDVHRRSAEGRGTFDAVERNLRSLLERDLPVDVVMVLTPRNIEHLPGSYDFLTREVGASTLCLNICHLTPWSAGDLGRLEKVLQDLADRLLSDYREGRCVDLNIFDEKIRAHVAGRYAAEDLCPFGRGKVAVDVDGLIYPCDRIAAGGGRTGYAIGSVGKGIDLVKAGLLLQRLRRPQTRCLSCEARDRCRNFCGCVNVESTGRLDASSDLLCFTEKLAIRCADGLAAALFEEANPVFLAKFYGEAKDS
jgi:uncharacterized protein